MNPELLDQPPPRDISAEKAVLDPYLEGSIRKLIILGELASCTFFAFDPGDRQILDGLREVAGEVRDRLSGVPAQ